MSGPLHWLAGDSCVRAAVEDWWAHSGGAANLETHSAGEATRISTSPRRIVVRLQTGSGSALLLKIFRPGRAADRLRERLQRPLARTPAQREWRGLNRLQALRVAAPEPLGRARIAAGGELLVMRFIDGETLHAALARDPTRAREQLAPVAELIGRLHSARVAHGDLHPGNLLLGPKGPVLIDLQRLHESGSCRWGRRADLARLDFSLARSGVGRDEREQLILRALGLSEDATPRSRRLLHRIERASRRAALRHERRRRRERARREERGGKRRE